jgi:RNA polymerase sigma factor (sigma-70 family)
MENSDTKPPMNAEQPMPPARAAETADAVLLQQFVRRRDETAFAQIVERHGPLVLSACMRILNHRQDAEDAFQTTFLVLARKAGSITRRQSLSSWIYRVAFRVALKARSVRTRQAMSEINVDEVPAPDDAPAWVWRDMRPVLDEEVNRLPMKYRLPFILCYLEGKTNAQAAATLKCPPGTVMSRLAWARERLRNRLALRGVALSTGALAAVLGQQATAAALPAALAGPTVANAILFATGQAGQVAVRIARPAEELLRVLFRTQVTRIGAYTLAVVGIAGLSLWLAIVGIGVGRQKGVDPLVAGPAGDDHALMQGVWLPERLAGGGQEFPRDNLKVAFTADTFELFSPDGAGLALRFVLDQTAEPATIDFYEQGATPFSRGIYRLDGDALLICYSMDPEERPKLFDSAVSARTMLYQLKRETPKR